MIGTTTVSISFDLLFFSDTGELAGGGTRVNEIGTEMTRAAAAVLLA